MKITKWSLFDLLQLYPLIEITLAFKSNGSLGRSMGAPRPATKIKTKCTAVNALALEQTIL
jgi:hypothetical protein